MSAKSFADLMVLAGASIDYTDDRPTIPIQKEQLHVRAEFCSKLVETMWGEEISKKTRAAIRATLRLIDKQRKERESESGPHTRRSSR